MTYAALETDLLNAYEQATIIGPTGPYSKELKGEVAKRGIAKIKAEALREAADDLEISVRGLDPTNPPEQSYINCTRMDVAELRNRADKIERGSLGMSAEPKVTPSLGAVRTRYGFYMQEHHEDTTPYHEEFNRVIGRLLLHYSEWLDREDLIIPDYDSGDERTHEELVRDFTREAL